MDSTHGYGNFSDDLITDGYYDEIQNDPYLYMYGKKDTQKPQPRPQPPRNARPPPPMDSFGISEGMENIYSDWKYMRIIIFIVLLFIIIQIISLGIGTYKFISIMKKIRKIKKAKNA